ncbi:MAG TPA: reverse transcriptase/maturase family protein [Alphaproteobacteria bacterium]|nr:reverse transcriptase/maturase family protein [Alphaproteobacteria bacterium]
MAASAPSRLVNPLRWNNLYSETELCRAAVRVYTKPLFQWRKALSVSTDGKTLYDFAAHGLRGLDSLHRSLERQEFRFRPAVALHHNFNGKLRTLYVSPWEERIVDLMLYRALNRQLHTWFSPNSYAYRDSGFSLDRCQSQIAAVARSSPGVLYLIKRDISDYFASVNHDILLSQLAQLIDPADYLFQLLAQRIRFRYQREDHLHTAEVGIPFGSAIACLFANIYLTRMDRLIENIPGVSYFRYADDILLLAPSRELALTAMQTLESSLAELRLKMKASHSLGLVLSAALQLQSQCDDPAFTPAAEFRHLGLLFRADGTVALSRDKLRKIQNLFRFAFRRGRRRWKKIADPQQKAAALISLAAEAIGKGLRNVAILDYYLKHVDDHEQLRLLDRWLAEEVLASVFGGHKKGHFRRISFARLRQMGLPSLVHRQRLIRRGEIESPFFIWQKERSTQAFRGTVARLQAPNAHSLLSGPKSSGRRTSVREDGRL